MGLGRLWVADRDGGEILGVVPRTGDVRERMPLGVPVDVKVVGDGLWALDLDDGLLLRLGPRDGARIREINVPVVAPAAMAVEGDDMWILGAGDGAAAPINLTQARIVRSGVKLPAAATTALAAGAGALWVADPVGETLLRIDPIAVTVESIPTPTGFAPMHVAAAGCIWAASADGRMARFDPARERWIGAPVTVGRSAGGIALDGAAVWVSDPIGGTVRRVSAAR